MTLKMPNGNLTCRIVALNYNGKELLRNFLPSWLQSAEASSYRCAVTVLDNQSSDGSIEFVSKNYPSVDIFLAKENRVLCSYNEIAAVLKEDILIFLNNDIQTEKGFVDPLIRPFAERDDMFFVVPYGCRSIPKSRWGTVSAAFDYPEYEFNLNKAGYVYSAGSGAFDRKKFLEIGGYDDIYLPGYYEDVDLCHRGWKKGWVGYCSPESRVHHLGSVSFNKRYSEKEKQALVFRNGVFFMIKNITDHYLFIKFIFGLILKILWAIGSGKHFILKGFGMALTRLPEAWGRRATDCAGNGQSDKELFKVIRDDIS